MMALTPDQEKLKEAALAANKAWPSLRHMRDHHEASNPAAILAILAQLEQVQGWQPIETAPKDREIWAFNGEQGRMKWSEGIGYAGDEGWELWVWSDELLDDADPSPDQPTHFQPLPPPPEAA